MGIPGLKDELGSGERISLARFSIGHLQRTSRPLRLAVDISIWLFQVQAAQGGANPALRTLFFRLTRLISLPIQPIFVFDGPHRPDYKRGRLISKNAASREIELSRKLIKLFSYPCHTAPGEAEAECAKLQRTGVVDAVLSNDVDALMFGSKVTLLNFSKGSAKQSGAATHADLYDTEAKEGDNKVSLDIGGMVLVALLSGGDYSPAGVSFCGPKLAAEIARAGFGEDLLEITRDMLTGPPDSVTEEGLREWRERLQYELETNESGYFKTKHKAVRIPDDFPNMAILQNCVHPVTSTPKKLNAFRNPDLWSRKIDVGQLRAFVGDYLGWKNLIGAKNFIRKLAPSLLSYELFCRSLAPPRDEILVKISASKSADAFDGLPVLKLEYVPLHVVGLNLELETVPTTPQEDEVINLDSSDTDGGQKESQIIGKKRTLAEYNPALPQTIWVFEALARCGIPEAVDKWTLECKEKEAAKKRPAKKPTTRRTKVKVLDPGMKLGSIRQYGVITKGPAKQTDATSSLVKSEIPSSSDQRSSRNENSSIGSSGTSSTVAPASSSMKKTDAPDSSSFGSWDSVFSDPLDCVVLSESTKEGRTPLPIFRTLTLQNSNLQDSIVRSVVEVELAMSRINISDQLPKANTQPKATRSVTKKPNVSLRQKSVPIPSRRLGKPKESVRDNGAIPPSSIPTFTSSEFPSLTELSAELDSIEHHYTPIHATRTPQNIVDQRKIFMDKSRITPAPTIATSGPNFEKSEQAVVMGKECSTDVLHVNIKDGFWSYAEENIAAGCPYSSTPKGSPFSGSGFSKAKCLGRVSIVDLT
ncbi:uncharacterized protein GIQ15_00961 [Arthroderma uncinatum]|uniref:uncharacterized protein n=1 Tax=Arthroderma uncinatum TaxID=74035 RepID=UPI00144A84D0|nr:uncharacterized protein GIQ15_00961 [Arthroderma uncinatum]KAF3491444.1 hypothetical protein GIQ15_00961 [Arthroderma uncinatum]